jgi:hypothetical protein
MSTVGLASAGSAAMPTADRVGRFGGAGAALPTTHTGR